MATFKNMLVKGSRRAVSDVRKRPSMLLIALVAGAVASFVFEWPVAAVWALFILFLTYGWDMRIVIATGIISVLACIVLAVLGKGTWAVSAAVAAYLFFGSAGVIWFVRSGWRLV